jgi:ribose transport system permease protein
VNKNSAVRKALISTLKTVLLPSLVIVAFAILTNGRSASQRMLLNTIRQSIVPMLICWGLMMTMSMGMMNFCGGATMLCAGIIGGNLAKMCGSSIGLLLLFTIIIGVLIGVIIGALYNKMRVPCMVLTIGLMLFFEALPRAFFTGGVRMPSSVVFLSMAPNCYYVALVMLVIFYILYECTAFGHNMRAIGANPSIAASVGLNADGIKFKAFTAAGLFFGVAAALYVSSNGEVRNVSYLGSMQIMMDGFMGMFLALFMSTFCKMPIAVVVSTFTMKMMSNGFVALGMSATVRDLANGIFLLVLLTLSANEGILARKKAENAFKMEAEAERANS